MSDIKFNIPLALYVDDVYVTYERTNCGFIFHILLDDEEKAMEVAKEIIQKMIREHDESQHGVSWRIVSLEVIPQKERYKIGTLIEWKYRVRDSY